MGAIGVGTLVLALAASLFSAFAYFIGARNHQQSLLRSARYALIASGILLTIAVIILLAGILSHNFEMAYVAEHTSRQMAFPYMISALWAGNDGSLLFWAWLISICAFLSALLLNKNATVFSAYSSGVTMVVLAFFTLVLVTVANPFEMLDFTPADGAGLNPLLQNPGMIIHPPLLLAGFAVFTIPFSNAIAALLSNKLGIDWITASRKWTIFAWLLLGAGNIVGAWWAYVELGWGGYWAWDPVENAGLMPWLLATAFLHSVMIQKRAGKMKVWNVTLILFTFILIIFGTYITRSGVLASVHTYTETGIGTFLAIFVGVLSVLSIYLLISRRKTLKSDGDIDTVVTREGNFLIANILFVLATLIIFIGTVFPGIVQAFSGNMIEVGPGFFNRVNGPLFLLVIVLLAICSVTGWRDATPRAVLKKLIWPTAVSAVGALVLWLLVFDDFFAFIVFFLSGLALCSVIYQWTTEIMARRRSTNENPLTSFISLFRRNRARYGAYIVHLGIIILAIGVIGSSIFESSVTKTLEPGEQVEINNYALTFIGVDQVESGDQYIARAELTVSHSGSEMGSLYPEKVYHGTSQQVVSEVDIRSNLIEDLYVAFGQWNEDGSALFVVNVNPLVIWIWIGGFILGLGGLICFWPDKNISKAVEATPRGAAADVEAQIEEQVRNIRKQNQMKCPNCGKSVRANSRFCSECGAKLDE